MVIELEQLQPISCYGLEMELYGGLSHLSWYRSCHLGVHQMCTGMHFRFPIPLISTPYVCQVIETRPHAQYDLFQQIEKHPTHRLAAKSILEQCLVIGGLPGFKFKHSDALDCVSMRDLT